MTVPAQWFLWFIIYSFLGWVYESIECSIEQRKLINRGFLTGPVCPIYGFGALLVLLVLDGSTESVPVLFMSAMVMTTTLEYVTALLLEKLFNAKWWDYSNYHFNLHGRICLLATLVFGIMSVVLLKYIHPLISSLTGRLTERWIVALSLSALTLMLADLFLTVKNLLLLDGRLREIQAALNCFLDKYAKRAGALKKNFEESEFYTERIRKLFRQNPVQIRRILRAFPKMKPVRHTEAWQKLKSFLLDQDGK